MTRRRWIADERSGNRAALTGEHARHLAQVLRAQLGQEFEISTGNEVRLGRITSIDPERVKFELGDLARVIEVPQITVAISIFKFDRMEWAIEKCTEMGVAEIIPVVAGRTEARLALAADKRVERWRKIARQAAEQSRRVSSPGISQPIKFKELAASKCEARIVLSEVESENMMKDAVRAARGPLLLAFGPEGGWKETELDEFLRGGWIACSLGQTILRTETAVIAAVAIAIAELQS
jgi:16S rRNA (uracil1498-N3)-methyltransferase